MRRRWLFALLLVPFLLPLSILDARQGSSHRSSSRSYSRSTRSKTVHVRSYTRKDGTVVRAHTRSYPGTRARENRSGTIHARSYSGGRQDSRGHIKRSESAKHAFMRQTGYPRGRSGYVVDHKVALACGGADNPSNMQWQTVAEAKAKDKWERKGCK